MKRIGRFKGSISDFAEIVNKAMECNPCRSYFCPGNDVFFLETMGRESLTDRQACAVESMARHNTNLTVHVLTVGATNHSAPAMQVKTRRPLKGLKQLNTLGR